MTTTPTIWKSGFSPNIGAQAGSQSVPQTIGLANGNILVVWEDDTQGPSPFTDIMGQMFSPEGVAMGYGAAIAVVLFAIMLVFITLFVVRMLAQERNS